MNLGKQIRQLRQLCEYSQEYLGNETGIGQTSISRIENNKISPSYCQLQQIARVLQVELSLLLNFDVESIFNTLSKSYLSEGGATDVFGIKEAKATVTAMLRIITKITQVLSLIILQSERGCLFGQQIFMGSFAQR